MKKILLLCVMALSACKLRPVEVSNTKDVALSTKENIGTNTYLYWVDSGNVHRGRCGLGKATRETCKVEVSKMPLEQFEKAFDEALRTEFSMSTLEEAVRSAQASVDSTKTSLEKMKATNRTGMPANQIAMLDGQIALSQKELVKEEKALADAQAALGLATTSFNKDAALSLLKQDMTWDFTLPSADKNLLKAVLVFESAMKKGASAGGAPGFADEFAQDRSWDSIFEKTKFAEFEIDVSSEVMSLLAEDYGQKKTVWVIDGKAQRNRWGEFKDNSMICSFYRPAKYGFPSSAMTFRAVGIPAISWHSSAGFQNLYKMSSSAHSTMDSSASSKRLEIHAFNGPNQLSIDCTGGRKVWYRDDDRDYDNRQSGPYKNPGLYPTDLNRAATPREINATLGQAARLRGRSIAPFEVK